VGSTRRDYAPEYRADDRHTRGDARGDPQHLPLARRAGQSTGVQRRHRGLPVDPRPPDRWFPAHLHEPADEILTAQPPTVADQQLNSRLAAVQATGVRAQPTCTANWTKPHTLGCSTSLGRS
jgi:hypothetical protein